MKDYTCIMMTARGCGHCAHSRGSGIMGSGPHFMKPTVLDEFLSISPKVNFMNIHFENMSGKKNMVREISKFYKDGSDIFQEMWSVNEEHVSYLRLVAESATKKFRQTKIAKISENGQLVKWSDFVDKKIPVKVERYTYYYPCFLLVETKNWVDSINSNTEIYGITNAGKTKKTKNGDVMLDRDGKSFNERMVEPKQLIKDVVSGKQKFVPHIDDKSPPKQSSDSATEKHKEKPPHRKKHNTSKIVRY